MSRPPSARPALLILALVSTAACGGQTTSRKPVDYNPPAPSPAYNVADFNAAVADDKRAFGLPETSVSRIPYGNASYDGHVRSSAIIENQAGYDVIGDLALDVDINSRSTFAGRNPITGSITDMTVIDRQARNRLIPLEGRLDIRGDSTSGLIEATAIGDLTRSNTNDTARWAIDLDGSFRDDFTTADTVTGAASGGTTGGSRDDYNVELTGNGRFYAN
ncbi:hypothetical protein FHS72_000328 [Loktanella ponticola]|uniref:Transferrin-binding protein B C-lobe/N-lobe beta barrel domain-containing protein n=1 Tax=Yoonia ponticola TaxID=1524255 RepID=A0A7W9BHR0_9RHOB|nr:hypothetical protein [Yoonia ponticola]MBB5720724.1 hypothetical protein [Yoonia ponticola]